MIVRGVFLITVICSLFLWPVSMFAMDREPDNFQGIKWGTDIGSLPDMEVVNKSGSEKMASRMNEKMTIGKATVGLIRYFFYKGKFYSVYISFTGRDNFLHLKQRLTSSYGPPEQSRMVNSYYWFGKDVDISFRYNEMLGIGSITYSYLPINDELKKERK